MSELGRILNDFEEALRDDRDLKNINPESAGGDMLTDAYYTIGAKNPNAATQFANQAKKINDIGKLKSLKDTYYKRYNVKDSDNIYEYHEEILASGKNLRYPADSLWDDEREDYKDMPDNVREWFADTNEGFNEVVYVLENNGFILWKQDIEDEEIQTAYIMAYIARDKGYARGKEMPIEIFRSDLWDKSPVENARNIVREFQDRRPEIFYEAKQDTPEEKFNKVVTPVFKALRYTPKILKVDDSGVVFQLYRDNKPVGKKGRWGTEDLLNRTFNQKLRDDVIKVARQLVPNK